MNHPIKQLSRRERVLWLGSLAAVALSNAASASFDLLTLCAALIGVTALLFAAKGNAWAQVLNIVFSVLYGIISYRFRYWGEMATYLGMTLPMSVWSLITWLRHPGREGEEPAVAIRTLNRRHGLGLVVCGGLVTGAFYLLLRALDTPNLGFSTLSVVTSFLATSLTMLRSAYYALGYAANDLVLVVLWVLASLEDPGYIPVAVNFSIFFFNDLYGFVSWRRRELRQAELAETA